MAAWLTLGEAETYFATRLNAAAWASASDGNKQAALTTGQADLEACPDFTFDADTEPTEAQQRAVCEQALFLLADPDIDARLSLQSQGVVDAGMIKERYSGAAPVLPIAPRARGLLASGGFGSAGISSFRVER